MGETNFSSPSMMKQVRPTTSSSLLSSPRFFNGFCAKPLSETDSVMSPTSILDTKPFSDHKQNSSISSRLSTEPCVDCKSSPRARILDSKSVGLIGIVDALVNDETNNKHNSNSNTPMVLFGSQLKIQIPSVLSPAEDSPKFPTHLCIETRNPRHGSPSFSPGLSPNSAKKSPFGSLNSCSGTPFTGCLSASEMELSEDYTCVISHGPNPRTTHIFEDCIVDDCFGFNGVSSFKKESCFSTDHLRGSFLSFCYNCKKSLVQGKDIYMYRGEKAFCSGECRQREIQFDEEMEKAGMDY